MSEHEREGAMNGQGDAHPDDGTIHAWLDRQLDATSSATLEAHLQRCDECAERVAEARGLIAGASRILASLDDEGAEAAPLLREVPVTPSAAVASVPPASAAARATPAWRWLRVTPARAAIAATLLVAVGVTLTRKRTGPDTVPTLPVAGGAGAPAAAGPRDHLLDSAVARNVAKAQPPRSVEAAAAPPISVAVAELAAPAPSPASIAATDSTAARRVAVARAALRTGRDTAVGADLARVADATVLAGRATGQRTVAAAAKVADSVVTAKVAGSLSGGSSATRDPLLAGAECYRIESATGTAAEWGPVALPLLVALDGTAQQGGARVLTATGVETGAGAAWTRAGGDSLLFHLRRIGYDGTLALGAVGEVRAGVMRSRRVTLALSDVVVTGAASADERRTQEAPRSRLKSSPPAAEQSVASGAPAVPVIGRRVSCPGR